MPLRPQRVCIYPCCTELAVSKSYCKKHARRDVREGRASAYDRGYDHRWRAIRASYIAANPLCAHCASRSVVEPATEVDHITPHKGDKALFYDPNNLQGLCKSCHSSKTAREVGFVKRF